jgi:hypothetical protein
MMIGSQRLEPSSIIWFLSAQLNDAAGSISADLDSDGNRDSLDMARTL